MSLLQATILVVAIAVGVVGRISAARLEPVLAR